MSANRSVQAAQRRRSGPTDATPGSGRGPQPSINSSQMFASQPSRPGQGTTGRLAGQQAALQQQQMQQQQQTKPEGLTGISKMTLPQAITLITLRLGSVETKLMNLEHNGVSNNMPHSFSVEGQENMVLIDNSVLESITSRLESLEKRSAGSSTSASASGPEVNLLKQQFETLKQAVIQSKGVSASLTKDNKDLKINVDNLKQELNETKALLSALQNLTMDNTQKIMNMSLNMDQDDMEYDNQSNGPMDINDLTPDKLDLGDNEIVGTNLKELIESEINAEM
jgi:hypothetical protein